MSELYEALEQEQQVATNYLYSARVKGDELDAAYWLGYLEGSTNAAALVYGPTPLEQTRRLWVASDGSFGTTELEQFNCENWTHDDWQELDAANDWDRLAVANKINRRFTQGSGVN